MSHSSSCHCSKEIVDYLQVDCKAKIKGDVKIKGDLRVDGKTNLKGDVTVDGAIAINGPLDINSNVTLDGTTTVNGALNVAGDAHFQQPTLFDQDINAGGNIYVNGQAAVEGQLIVNGAASFSQNVNVLGDLTVQGSILPLRSVIVDNTSIQTPIPSGGALRTTVEFDNIVLSNGLTFDTTNFWFSVPTSGIYSFSVIVTWAAFADNTARGVGFQVDTTEFSFSSNINLFNVSSPSSNSAVFPLVAGQLVQVRVAQTSGVDQTILNAGTILTIAQLR